MPGRSCIFRIALWVTTVSGIVAFIRWLNKGLIKDIENRYILVTGCDSGKRTLVRASVILSPVFLSVPRVVGRGSCCDRDGHWLAARSNTHITPTLYWHGR
jgi:hypothetical protein